MNNIQNKNYRLVTPLDRPEDIDATMDQFIGDGQNPQHRIAELEADLRSHRWVEAVLCIVVMFLAIWLVVGVEGAAVVAGLFGIFAIYITMNGTKITGDDKVAERIGN